MSCLKIIFPGLMCVSRSLRSMRRTSGTVQRQGMDDPVGSKTLGIRAIHLLKFCGIFMGTICIFNVAEEIAVSCLLARNIIWI